MFKLNLTPTINLQRPDKNGKYPVRIRATVKKKVIYYPTGINVLANQFHNKEIVKHPNKEPLNALIRQRINEIERNYIEGELSIKTDSNFLAYCEKKISQSKNRDAKGTWKHKVSYLKKLREFSAFIRFSEVTSDFMHRYENFCKEKGNKQNTIWGSCRFVKMMVNLALNEGVIKTNPLKGYKSVKYINPQREFLTDEEIDKLEDFAATSMNYLKDIANWFLFGIYTGLRFSDVEKFDKSKIVGNRIILRTTKTKTDVSVKIHPRLKDVIERLNGKIISNQKINNYLKIIAERCGIEKNLTYHLARHTYSVYFLNHGGSMETLSKILGHNSLRTTQIYSKIVNRRIDEEIDKVWC